MQTPTPIRSANLKSLISVSPVQGNGRPAIRPLVRAKKTIRSEQVVTKTAQSPKAHQSASRSSIGMFSAGEARCDRWQELAHAAQTLVAQSSAKSPNSETVTTVEATLQTL